MINAQFAQKIMRKIKNLLKPKTAIIRFTTNVEFNGLKCIEPVLSAEVIFNNNNNLSSHNKKNIDVLSIDKY